MSRRRIRAGRWCLTVQRFRASRTAYSAGGQRTPGPWWSLSIRWCGVVVLSHDRTIFGWEGNR